MKRIITPVNQTCFASFFEEIPIFKDLKKADLIELSKKTSEVTYDKGDIICKKDRLAHTVYIVRSGAVTEFAMDSNDFTVMIKKGRKYDCFGELGVLLVDNYVTTVVAASTVTLLSIPDEYFRKVVWENNSAIKEILALCLIRLQKSALKSISYTMFNSEGRLAYILLMLHNERIDPKYIKITQEKLSVKCGIARQTASVILNAWKKNKLIEIQRGKIAILDAELLTDIAINGAKSY